MALTEEFVERIERAGGRRDEALHLPWPMPGDPASFLRFDCFAEWKGFVTQLGLRNSLPDIIAAKFDRAHKLLLLTWLDFDLIKASELSVLSTLELALMDRYADSTRKAYGLVNFAHLLRHLPEHDGLTDDKLPIYRRCRSGTVIPMLMGSRKSGLAKIRNDLAHGYPFDGFPYAGLFEFVRDLIDYAYRDFGRQA